MGIRKPLYRAAALGEVEGTLSKSREHRVNEGNARRVEGTSTLSLLENRVARPDGRRNVAVSFLACFWKSSPEVSATAVPRATVDDGDEEEEEEEEEEGVGL